MSGNQLQSALESMNQPSINRFQTSLESLNQLQTTSEHLNQLQTPDDMSLMYLLQQQQHASIVNTSSSSSAMMMMSPTTLQSLLMAAIQQHPSASQYIVGTMPTISVQMTIQSDVGQRASYQTTASSSQCLTTTSIQNVQTTVPTSLVQKAENVAPKKPLTPYMKFSKSIWQHVKNANPSLSVCEVGANIGRMWREMPEADKHRYNDDFSREKAQYEVELQEYIRSSGAQPTDTHKIKSVIVKKPNAKDKYPRSTPSDVSSNNVLPHIGQIWSSNHNHQVPGEQLIDNSNGQLTESLLPRSMLNDGLPQTDINIDLADSLLTSSQLAWLEQNDDAKRLLGGETEFSDGLEPGEVVFDEVPVVAKTAHNLFNSYAFNPWKRFKTLSVNTSNFERDHLLESERRHLRLALEDKMSEVRELTSNIQKAYETIDELRRILVERQQDEETGRANGCGVVAEVEDQCYVERSSSHDETVDSDANILQVLSESNETRWTNDNHYQPTHDSLSTPVDHNHIH